MKFLVILQLLVVVNSIGAASTRLSVSNSGEAQAVSTATQVSLQERVPTYLDHVLGDEEYQQNSDPHPTETTDRTITQNSRVFVPLSELWLMFERIEAATPTPMPSSDLTTNRASPGSFSLHGFMHETSTVRSSTKRPAESTSDLIECPICLEPLVDTADDVDLLRCAHRFHKHCMTKWKETKAYPTTCPLCRTTIPL